MFFIAAKLTIVSAVCVLLSTPALAQAPMAQRPVVKVGEVSTYRNEDKTERKVSEVTMTVAEVLSEAIKFKFAVGPENRVGEIGYTADLNPLGSITSGAQFEPAAQLLVFPMAVGKEWKQNYGMKAQNGATSKVDTENKVIAWEKIKVPAGEFEAYRIEGKGWMNGVSWQGSRRIVQTNWYSPEVGRMVKQEYQLYRDNQLVTHIVSELASRKPAP